jgi:hypothetical protein
MSARILTGDCLLVMPTLDANSVDAIVCDPPYELGFMGKRWDSSGVAFRPETWAAALRVAKPGRTSSRSAARAPITGSRARSRMRGGRSATGSVTPSRSPTRSGRGGTSWRTTSARPRDLARQWEGWGTALKPAWEPIILARKPLVGTVAANVTAHGTGALNIDGCRIEVTDAA